MNAFRISVWRSVSHNGKFVTNNQRVIIIHAMSEEKAKSKIKLKEATENHLRGLEIKTSKEVIYSCEKIGTVEIHPFYVYSNRDYGVISFNDYQRELKQFNNSEVTK